jgi:hypothetical protein
MVSKSSRSRTLREFHKLVNAGNIDDVKVQYRVSGGPPGNQLAQEVNLPGGDAALELNIRDERVLSLDITKKRSLFKQIALGARASLSIPEKPVFLPDSVVASLTIQVKDKEPTTVQFLVDKTDRRIQNKPIPREIADAVERFERIIQMSGGKI